MMSAVSAFNRTLILLLAILFMAVLWGVGRLPDAALLMVVFTCLSSALLIDIRSFGLRLKMAAVMGCYSCAAQFLISVSAAAPFRQMVIATLFAFFTFATLPDRRQACVVMLIGCLAFSVSPGFAAAVGRCPDILIGVIVIMIVTTAGSAGTGQLALPAMQPYSLHEALALASELGIGMLIFRLLQLKQGVWIMLTILFIAMNEAAESSVKKFAYQRILAVPLGIIAGGFLLGTFCRIDYRFIWLVPFIGAAGFFMLYNYGNFFLFSIIFMIAMTLFADWAAGPYQRFNFWESFFSRSAATVYGALLELFLWPHQRVENGDTL